MSARHTALRRNAARSLPPSVLSRLTLELHADRGVADASGVAITADGTKAKTWTDTRIGGAGFVGTQATVGNQPTWIRHAHEKRPALRFFGASSLAVPDNVLLRPDSGAFRVFMVARIGVAKLGIMLAKGNTGSTVEGYAILTDYTFPNAITAVRVSNSGGTGRGSQVINGLSNRVDLIELALDGTNIFGFLNGLGGWTSGGEGPASNAYTVPVANTESLIIGANGTPTYGYVDIFDLLIFKGTLSAEEITGIRRYLMPTQAAEPPAVSYQGSERTVWINGTGHPFIRIPAIVRCNDNTLLAFAEGRQLNGDSGQIEIIQKRSTDNGVTWSAETVVRTDGTNTCGNPAPIVNRATGRVHLVSCWQLGTDTQATIEAGTSGDVRKIYHQYSNDSGVTWSAAAEITASVKIVGTWRWYATGPGGNEQLASGRLLIPCNHSDPAYGAPKYKAHAVYSDDDGVTWARGGLADSGGVNEGAIAQNADASVYYSLRNETNLLRWQSTSTDDGATWSAPTQNVQLTTPACQGDVIAAGGVLVFCGPNSAGGVRTDMTARISTDKGVSWPASTLIHAGSASYSDMVVMAGGDIGMLYEISTVTSIAFGVAAVAYPQ